MSNPPETHLHRILLELGMKPSYTYQGEVFWDTCSVFDRHNLARDVKRTLDESEWVCEQTKYYISATGILRMGFIKGNGKVIDPVLAILNQTAPAEAPKPAQPMSFYAPHPQSAFVPYQQSIYYQYPINPYAYVPSPESPPVLNQ